MKSVVTSFFLRLVSLLMATEPKKGEMGGPGGETGGPGGETGDYGLNCYVKRACSQDLSQRADTFFSPTQFVTAENAPQAGGWV